MLQLKNYQQRCLDELESYLRLTVREGAKKAFVLQTDRPYLEAPRFPNLPYVCLRIPTGGGKTLMACHALGIATRAFLQQERTVCLWLVPTNQIREQTLKALRDRAHPYRQAIDARFSGQVRVMDLAEALYVQRGTLEGETCIIVSTLAALRVDDTEGRKIYAEAGALQHHFSHIRAGTDRFLDRRPSGSVICSLANVLAMWRPLVLMDEAHNARTPLSFDTLARFAPSCVIEFTATPQTKHRPEVEEFASNVLCHVSAVELKAEEMVKLPIRLKTHGDYKEIIAETVATQRELEKAAQEEERAGGDYLRPIVLLQAQAADEPLTVDVVKKTLLEDFKISEEQVAIATGQTRQIEDVDLFDKGCSIRFIITVQALKEGWDCSFAYILCSVAELGSARAVEQILGRILRLPRAKRKSRPELNCAYAFVTSQRFSDTAAALKDRLVANGFERIEVDALVSYGVAPPAGVSGMGGLFPTASVRVSSGLDRERLAPALREKVFYSEGVLCATATLSVQETAQIQDLFSGPEDKVAVEQLGEMSRAIPISTPPPSAKEKFRIPALAIRRDGQLEMFEESHFLDIPWNLAGCDAALSDTEFPSRVDGGTVGLVDVTAAGRVAVGFVQELHEQQMALFTEPGWTLPSFVHWLDRQIPHPDITPAQAGPFILKAVDGLMKSRGLSLEQLARQKYRLARAIEDKIETHRRAQRGKGYQQTLFGPGAGQIEVSPEVCFDINLDGYTPRWLYEGPPFSRHYFLQVGELKSEGEEYECAKFLDGLPQVKFWVRNLERNPRSFWLQTSSDKFYPDFVCMLQDGRILVVESKGEHLWSNDDSKEKRILGQLWAERSGGRCLFVMPKGTDWEAIGQVIKGSAGNK